MEASLPQTESPHYSKLIDLINSHKDIIMLVSNRLILIKPAEVAELYDGSECVQSLKTALENHGWKDISVIMNHYRNGEMVFEHNSINEGTIQRENSKRRARRVKSALV